MSTWDFSQGPLWQGKPIARRVADARARRRAVISGVVISAKSVPFGSSVAYECMIEDGTGELRVVFTGRESIQGLARGARCTVEATIQANHSGLFMRDPLYRLAAE
ncbi:MAG: hypothetical protein M1115_02845 [Actinobacteria bacterium]|nr:hypothetical protein [Actinomycetota bacterium]